MKVLMDKPKGGRGKKAPYETITVRVPLPLQESIDAQIESYRQSVFGGVEQPVDMTKPLDITKVSYSDAVNSAKEILKQKKSARQSLEKLLRVLYGGEISLKD